MIEYLEKLIQEGKYREALKLTEQILQQGLTNPRDLLAVHNAVLYSHCYLQEYGAALPSGELVLKLAAELGEWDYFGKAAFDLGAAYSCLGRQADAISQWYDYIAHRHLYRDALALESGVWYNLGLIHGLCGQHQEATKALANALATAKQTNRPRHVHGIRQALIDAYLRVGELSSLPRLLATCAHYLRDNPDAYQWQKSWVYHMKQRAEFALATGRDSRALLIAVRGLQKTQGNPQYEFHFHILLSKIALRKGISEEASGHSLSARSCAVRTGRTDLEAEAADMLYQVTQAFPVALEETR